MRQPHLSDSELIRLADGEMSSSEASGRRRHLTECWACRARAQEIESTIGEFVRYRNQDLSSLSPSAGSRAIFRARLSEVAKDPAAASPAWSFRRAFPAFAAGGVALLAMLITFGGTVNADGPKPRTNLTPGETRPVSLAEVCAAPETDDGARAIPGEVRRLVFASYGMDPAQSGAYEVDYLITPELGGAYSVRNLWPQPYSARWNARVKDKLEHRLHQLVCQGKIELPTAQRAIATDWIGAYRKYVSDAVPE